MTIKAIDPREAVNIECIPVELHGAAAGYDQNGNKAFGLIFRPEGSDPELVPDNELFQVLIDSKGLSEAITMLTSIRLGMIGQQ